MRMMPSRYVVPKSAQLKKKVSEVAHISAPLKGLSLSSKLTNVDPLSAPVLTNWVVEEDRITCRPGTRLMTTDADHAPVWHLVPFYGVPQRLAMATNGKLINVADSAVLRAGFTSNDWSWTSFSNLSESDYTVMVNGFDGVWSWDGGIAAQGPPRTVTNLSNANPAVLTLAPADIVGLVNGMTVVIAGANVSLAAANGAHILSSVNVPVNTVTLVGVNTSAAGAPQTTGVTLSVAGSVHKETITAPPTESWINPQNFDKTLSHMNRLWFADSINLAVYYLDVQSKSGEVKVVPLNALFKRGGHIAALYTWTVDGGAGMDDQLVVFSSNGECVIYGGTDPDSDFQLVGIFRFDSPMGKHCVVNYGGDLYVLTSTGLVPMTTMIRAETESLGKAEKNVVSAFRELARAYRANPGWQLLLDHTTGRMICNTPNGGGRYQQLVRFMPNPIWSQWDYLGARSWGWIDNRLFFGNDVGQVFEMHPNYLSDNGSPIRVDVQWAWSDYKYAGEKQFKMIRPYVITDGVPRPYVDMKVDYDSTAPINQPDVSVGVPGADWDTATWDVDYWAAGTRTLTNWSGTGALGHVGAPRVTASILNCYFAIAGLDVLYEEGAI